MLQVIPTPDDMSIKSWLEGATRALIEHKVASARLDSEIILAHTLRQSRTWLHAHGDEPIEPRLAEIADARLELRLDHTPVAYITGHREFYGRLFQVTPAVLIPRPETETAIELVKKYYRPEHRYLVDIGSGSGCIGISAKLELPKLRVTLADISHQALVVAEQNAKQLKADVQLIESDLLTNIDPKYDIIVANLPYVDRAWPVSPDLEHEPAEALYAENGGLALIYRLIEQAPSHLTSQGYLILESDPEQHPRIIKYAENLGFKHVETVDYYTVFSQTI